jgi:hypothetical protein
MNELSDLRALHTDAPFPDAVRLAPARARLTRTIHQETAPVRPYRRAFLLLAAAVAALAMTGAVVVSLPDAGGARPLSAGASAQALELAAATVEKRTVTEPGPKQWVYQKSTSFDEHGEPQSSEEWTRWDGTGYARLPGLSRENPDEMETWYGPSQEEQWEKEGYDDRSQRQFWRFLVTLPSDPDRMLRRIREEHALGDIEGETRAERDWREINVLYRSVLIPTNVQAGLFRALARIPGAHVERDIKDPMGRTALSVSVTYEHPSASGAQGRQELYFDPTTYAYLGSTHRSAPPEPPQGKWWHSSTEPALSVAPGSKVSISVRAAWGVVNKLGARP